MNLREYLFRKRISVTDFSKKLGTSRTYFSSIVNEKSTPSTPLANLIEHATEGEVKAKDLLNIKKKKSTRKKKSI